MFLILRELFGKDPRARYIENGYFGELLSPKQEPMQLDWYCEIHLDGEVIRIAYEHQGRQHFKHNPVMMSKAAYRYLRRCDHLKARRCQELGIALVPIRYDDPLTPEFLAHRLAYLYPELAARLREAGFLANHGTHEVE